MGDILVAHLFRGLVVPGVIVALGKPQSALVHSRHHHVRVLEVLLRPVAEAHAGAEELEPRHLGGELRRRAQRGDPVKLGPDRADPGRVDGLDVHPAVVEVPDQLLGRGRVGRRRGLLGEWRAGSKLVVVLDNVEGPHGRVVGRHLLRLQPRAVGVLVEVDARASTEVSMVLGSKSARHAGAAQRAPAVSRNLRVIGDFLDELAYQDCNPVGRGAPHRGALGDIERGEERLEV